MLKIAHPPEFMSAHRHTEVALKVWRLLFLRCVIDPSVVSRQSADEAAVPQATSAERVCGRLSRFEASIADRSGRL